MRRGRSCRDTDRVRSHFPLNGGSAAADAHAALAINHRGAAYLRTVRASCVPQESHLNPNSSSPFALAMNLNDMGDLHFGHCGAFIAAPCGLFSASDMTAFPRFFLLRLPGVGARSGVDCSGALGAPTGKDPSPDGASMMALLAHFKNEVLTLAELRNSSSCDAASTIQHCFG